MFDEEEREIEAYFDKVVEYVTRLLMMFVDKRLRVDKIVYFRRDMGLLVDFRNNWVYKYFNLFRVFKFEDDDNEYLEFVNWKNEWVVIELEKKVGKIDGDEL